MYVSSRFIGEFGYPSLGIPPLNLIWDLVIIFGLATFFFLSPSTHVRELAKKDYLLLIPIAACVLHFFVYRSYIFSSDSLFKALISTAFFACVVIVRRSRDTDWATILIGLIVFLLLCGGPAAVSLGSFLGEETRTLLNFGGIGQLNVYATVLATAALLLAYLDVYQRRYSPVITLACLALAAFTVCFTNSRVGFIGLIVGLIFLFFINLTQGQVRSRTTNLAAVAAGIGAYFLISYLPFASDGEVPILGKLNAIGTDSSTSFRLIVISLVPEIVLNRPLLGFGPNSSHLAIQHSFIEHSVSGPVFAFTHPHNLIADTIIESGIVGFILFCLPYFTWFLLAQDIPTFLIRLGVSFPLILHTQTELPLEQSGLFIFMFALAGVVTDRLPKQRLKHPMNTGRLSGFGGALCLVCLAVAVELGYSRHTLQTKFQESASGNGQERVTKLRSRYLSGHWYYGDFYRNRELLTIIDQKLISKQPRSACIHSNEMNRFTVAKPTAINYQVTSMLSGFCNDPLARQLTRTYSQLKEL